mgnify:CR=1 FL=1
MNPSSNCNSERSYVTSRSTWEKYEICSDISSCRSFALTFFGGFGAPQMIRILGVISEDGMLQNGRPIHTSVNSGYQGNISYSEIPSALKDTKTFNKEDF